MTPRVGRARSIALAVLVVGALAVLCGLGGWQLQRLAWKEALIAAASERPAAAAVAAPGPESWAGFPIADWDYRRVALTGRFAPSEVFAWTALTEPKGRLGGPGAFVVAPFVTDAGWTVFVNRGFVPDARREPATRPGSAPPAGEVRIEGLVRQDDPPTFVTPAPDPAARLVFSRDIATLSALLGTDPATTAPYTVDLVAAETPTGGLPQAGESLVVFSNNHLQYALTWFGLAAALVGVVLAALFRRRPSAIHPDPMG